MRNSIKIESLELLGDGSLIINAKDNKSFYLERGATWMNERIRYRFNYFCVNYKETDLEVSITKDNNRYCLFISEFIKIFENTYKVG